MAEQLEGFRYAEVRFGKSAQVVDDDERAAVQRLAADASVTDLVVLAHGWNNDIAEARRLYDNIAGSLREMADGGDADLVRGRGIALLGVLWPSKKFAEEDLIPGGAASLGLEPEDELRQRIAELADAFDAGDAADRLEEAKTLASSLEDSRAARRRFAELVRSVLPDDAGEDDDASQEFLEIDAEDLFAQLDDPTLDDPSMWLPPPQDEAALAGGAAAVDGAAAVLGDVPSPGSEGAAAGGGLGGRVVSARRLLNFATYYQMKARAGKVGKDGLAPLLRSVVRPDLRVHFVGHSFGGRLVTATAASADGIGGRLGAVALLQAAFSHYGFAQNWKPGKDGTFRPLLTGGKLSGPLIVTHTRNDKAVGVAYALASRIANQVGAAVGGPDSLYGGIGANGAQRTPEAVQLRLLSTRERYSFTPGKAHNLRADTFIAGHSTVSGREVIHAVLSAIATPTPP